MSTWEQRWEAYLETGTAIPWNSGDMLNAARTAFAQGWKECGDASSGDSAPCPKPDDHKQVEELTRMLRDHAKDMGYWSGTPNQLAKWCLSLMDHYKDETIKATREAKSFRDDILVYFRATQLLVEAAGRAGTHRLKEARLGGIVDMVEMATDKLREMEFGKNSYWTYPDVWRSDWPNQRLVEKLRLLEEENARLTEQVKGKKPVAEEDVDPDRLPF